MHPIEHLKHKGMTSKSQEKSPGTKSPLLRRVYNGSPGSSRKYTYEEIKLWFRLHTLFHWPYVKIAQKRNVSLVDLCPYLKPGAFEARRKQRHQYQAEFQKLIDLYHNSDLTVEQIGQKLGLSRHLVTKRVKENGLAKRRLIPH